LELSYKKVIEEDVLLAYFLENIDNLEYEIDIKGIGDFVIEETFKPLSYFT
jgi:hypothetical protein